LEYIQPVRVVELKIVDLWTNQVLDCGLNFMVSLSQHAVSLLRLIENTLEDK